MRYHLARIPEVAAAQWKLEVGGDAAEKPFTLDLAALQRDFEAVEIPAVLQCSGNRRGLSDPHVPGVEWGIGAMGNARWKGVRLKDLLARAGLKKEAVEVAFNGADQGSLDFHSGLREEPPGLEGDRREHPRCLADERRAAAPLERRSRPAGGPGWTGTYWMKHLVSIQALSQPLKNFWMASAYRIPKGKFPIVDRFLTQETDANTPITEMVVNSVITGRGRARSSGAVSRWR